MGGIKLFDYNSLKLLDWTTTVRLSSSFISCWWMKWNEVIVLKWICFYLDHQRERVSWTHSSFTSSSIGFFVYTIIINIITVHFVSSHSKHKLKSPKKHQPQFNIGRTMYITLQYVVEAIVYYSDTIRKIEEE